jgi:UDP-N-acetylmuramoylalanine-D-glutamate ligase
MSEQKTMVPEEVHTILARHMLTDGYEMVLDLEKSQGPYLHDAKSGKDYLDFFTFFASNPLGMNHPKLTQNPEFLEKIKRVAIHKPSNSDVYSREMAEFPAAHLALVRWRVALSRFAGVRRRLESMGEVAGIHLYDDFAHHPTAVAGTIRAARQRFGDERRVIALFEPRSYTAQRREFQQPYRVAFAGADRVVIAGLFHPERYDAESGMDPVELADQLRSDGVDARHIPDVDDIVRILVPELEPGDILLVMSNGGFGGIHQKLLDALGAGDAASG